MALLLEIVALLLEYVVRPIIRSFRKHIWPGILACYVAIKGTFEKGGVPNAVDQPNVVHSPGDQTNVVQPNYVPSPGVQTKTGRSSTGQLNPGQSSGNLVLFASQLNIKHVDNAMWWDWPVKDTRNERFTEVAVLKSVCHLEIMGTVNFSGLSLGTTYAAYLIFKTEDSRGLSSPQDAIVQVAGKKQEPKKVCLEPTMDTPDNIGQPQKRSDNWMQLELGQFLCDNEKGKAEIRIMEINLGREKAGLTVAGMELRPKTIY